MIHAHSICQYRYTMPQEFGHSPWLAWYSKDPNTSIWNLVQRQAQYSLWTLRESRICILNQHNGLIALQFWQLLLKPAFLLGLVKSMDSASWHDLTKFRLLNVKMFVPETLYKHSFSQISKRRRNFSKNSNLILMSILYASFKCALEHFCNSFLVPLDQSWAHVVQRQSVNESN